MIVELFETHFHLIMISIEITQLMLLIVGIVVLWFHQQKSFKKSWEYDDERYSDIDSEKRNV
jgi:PDZ domain-containing secreted protein